MREVDREVRGPTPETAIQARLDVYLGPLKLRVWFLFVLVLLLLLVGLMIGSLATKRWVTEGQGDSHWFGGLTSCSNCPRNWKDYTYVDIAKQLCTFEDPQFTHYCNAFEDLRDAGGQFLFFELVSIAMVIAWAVKILMILADRECLVRLPWSAYTYPLLATFFHWVGIILWGAVTNARFYANCDTMTGGTGKPYLCGTRGPIIAIVVAVLFPLVTILYTFAYIRIGSDPGKMKPGEWNRPGRLPKATLT